MISTARLVAVAASLALVPLPLACGSDGASGTGPGANSNGNGGNTAVVSEAKSCARDSDCPSGKGCYITDDPADAYCTRFCTEDSECSKQVHCPSLATLDESDCRKKSSEDKTVCQIFDSSLGPKGCVGGKAEPKAPDTNVKSCTKDAECGAGKGCYQTDNPDDSYCTELCPDDGYCPFQVDCPSFAVLKESDCRGKSSEQKGVCQIFDNSLGPKGCASRAPN